MADPTGKGGPPIRKPSDPPPALAPIEYVVKRKPGKKPNIRVSLKPDDDVGDEDDEPQIFRKETILDDDDEDEEEELYKNKEENKVDIKVAIKVGFTDENPEENKLEIKNHIEVDTNVAHTFEENIKEERKKIPNPDIKDDKKAGKRLEPIPVKKEHITAGKKEEKKHDMKVYKPKQPGKAVYVNKATGVSVKKVGKGDSNENVEDAPAAEEGEIDTTPGPKATSTPYEKKTKILVDPNASMRNALDGSHFMTSLPVVPEDDTPYSPILYTFRVKPKGKNTIAKHMIAKPPPFYLQFDHAIAVIWTIFNKNTNKENLGIVQLQWALHFLESIYNNEGVHPRDVQLCIDSIQEYLIEKYAEMSDEPAVYGTSKLKEYYKPEDSIPFSVNYSQMIKKCPRAGLGASESGELIDKQLLDELENVKKAVGIDSIDLTKVVSKDQVMNILFEWKKEQIDKIQEELKMLYVVEDMMKNSDSQNFEGYTDESQFQSVFRKN